MIQPSDTDSNAVDRSIFRHWLLSSLSLAISAVLTLIPLPQDLISLIDASLSLRRSYSQLFADSALMKAESEIGNIGSSDLALSID